MKEVIYIMGGFGGMMGFGGFGFIFMILFWVAIIAGAVYVIKMLSGKDSTRPDKERPEELLKKRYAGGEITKEEFEDGIDVLKRS